MRSINMGRVFLGGLLAGVIINISEFLLHAVVLKRDLEEAMKSMNRPATMTGGQTAVWIILSFVIGIAVVWLYAAIRPRYGPGPGTAARAGLAAWFFGNLVAAVVQANLGLFGGNLIVVPVIWTLVEAVVATVAGAWVYKEESAPAA
jgi:predicted permease